MVERPAERLLRPGVDFTTRGELKFARAVHLANELRGRIDEWSAAETLLARLHQPDPHTIEFRLIVRRAPPVEEWSLILGDALHNLRSAFDNVVWALAHLDGAQPRKPKQVAFPLTRDEGEWRERVVSLESVPPVFLERLRQIQPWRSEIELDDSLLGRLHLLDITDKHRGLIDSSLHMKHLMIGGLDLGFESVAEADEGTVSYETRKTPVLLEHDAILTTMRSSNRPFRPDPDYVAKVDVQFAITIDEGRLLFLDSYLSDLTSRTREWLDLVYGGEAYAAGRAASRQATTPSLSFGHLDELGRPVVTQLPFGEVSAGDSSA